MAGVTSTGWESKGLSTIEQEIKDALLAGVSPTLDLSSTSLLGQFVGAVASQLRQLWEAGQAVYAARDPDQAEDAQLEELARVTGTNRLAATYSTAVIEADLSATSYPHTFPAHTIVVSMAGNPDVRFNNDVDVTISGAEVDYEIAMTCETEGAITANIGTLTQSLSTGVTNATNPAAAVPGESTETISQLRIRRQESLASSGSGTVDAIRADLLAVDSVTGVRVYANNTDTTDANGVEPFTVHAIVLGGSDADVAEALWEAKAATDATMGNTTVVHVDSQGENHNVNFSRPTELLPYVSANVTVITDEYPSEEFATVEVAILHGRNYSGTGYSEGPWEHVGGILRPGEDLIRAKILAAIMDLPGVVDVTSLTLGMSPSPVGTANLVADIDEYYNINGANIVVNLTYVNAVP